MSRCVRVALLASLVALLPACTWVKIEPEAKEIRVVDINADMSRCGSMLSEISVSVRDRVGFVDRNAIKVRDELETLARNQAAGGQGDTLKPLSEQSEASNDTGRAGQSELREIEALVTAAGYGPDRIRIDPSVVRGLEYYTGPVFEAELLFEVKDEDGRPVRFGSVGGGGRYDGLVSRFLNETVPATGFSIGVSRLLAALHSQPVVTHGSKGGQG